jgi:hypothetical protein
VTRRALVFGSLVVAAVGLALLALGLALEPMTAWFAYLAAWTFGAGVCVGALLFLMVGHAAKASWMVVTQRLAEAVATALPLFLVLFLPLGFGLRHLYPWAAPTPSADPVLLHAIEHKRRYLNEPFFMARTALYFVVFMSVGALLRRWSRVNDAHPRMALVIRMRRLSAGAMPLVGLTLTWASFDWTMSLYPAWSSTIFGLYIFAGSFVGAIALVAVMLYLPLLGVGSRIRGTPDHAQALGRVLFAMVCFWAYMAFSQLLIYWIADLPDEVPFYVARTTGTWSAVTVLLVCGNFVVPFFLLLNRHWKRRGVYLAAVAAWLFLMHFVDVYWLVMPVRDPGGLRPHWLDFAAILFMGGLSCAWIVRRWSAVAPLPVHAPDRAEGLSYEAAL